MTDETLKAEKNQGEGFQPPFPGPLFPPTAGKVLIGAVPRRSPTVTSSRTSCCGARRAASLIASVAQPRHEVSHPRSTCQHS